MLSFFFGGGGGRNPLPSTISTGKSTKIFEIEYPISEIFKLAHPFLVETQLAT